jgi:subtilisin-like proprotein convertase family protein
VDDGDGCTIDTCTAPGTVTHELCEGLCDTTNVCLERIFTELSDTTDQAIPDLTEVEATIMVEDAGEYLRDIKVRASVTHAFSEELLITLTSPDGTIVTLANILPDGEFADVYNGTLWDSRANPEGQVPYTNNQGVASDHLYQGGVVATPLTPKESFGAFVGTNPNGVWTLTLFDKVTQDTGTLTEWRLELESTDVAPTINAMTYTQATSMELADQAITTSTLAVPASDSGGQICGATVTTNITHPFPGDLDITLTSPAGTIVTLTTDNAGGFSDAFDGTVWSDSAEELVTEHVYTADVATTLVPEEGLAAFHGEGYAGNWTLTVSDDAVEDVGMLGSWSLSIDRCMRVED